MNRWIIIAGFLMGSPALAKEPPLTIAITGGRVLTGDGADLARGTVLISAGKVTAVGNAKDVPVPSGAKVIDASGKVVYPGLVDGLTTIGLTEINGVAATVDVAEVGDVNPHAKAWVALNPHSDLIPVDRASGVTTVLSAPRGGLISGQSALIRLTGSTPAAMVVKAPAAMHLTYPSGRPARDERGPLSMGDDGPRPNEEKTFVERQRDRRENQEKELRRLANLLEEAKSYGNALDAARAGKIPPPRADLPMESLSAAARGLVPIVMRADDADDIRGAVKFATDHKLRLIVAGGLEASKCTDVLKKAGVPVLLTIDRLPRRDADPYDAPYTSASQLQAAGVRFAIVSDGDSKARNLPYEAAMARAFGLSPAAALRAITLSPAEIFGVADHLGSLAEGKDANLVIASGDIMDHRTVVTQVFIEGVQQPLETRQTRLYQQFKDRP
jgi:imidazolonepropionase-like amidohydrolase